MALGRRLEVSTAAKEAPTSPDGSETVRLLQDGAAKESAVNELAVTATGGSTARTLASRFADNKVDPRDFGAIGNDSPEDVAAMALAQAEAESSGYPLFIGRGKTYSSECIVSNGTLRILGEDKTSVIKLVSSASTISLLGKTSLIPVLFKNSGCSIENVTIDCAKTETQRLAFNAAGGTNARLYYGLGAYGASVNSRIEDITIKGVRIKNAPIFGVSARYVDGLDITGARVRDSGGMFEVMDCVDATLTDLLGRDIDSSAWKSVNHVGDAFRNQGLRMRGIGVYGHTCDDTIASGNSLSDYMSGYTILNNDDIDLRDFYYRGPQSEANLASLPFSFLGNDNIAVHGMRAEYFSATGFEFGSNANFSVDDVFVDAHYMKSSLTAEVNLGIQLAQTAFAKEGEELLLGRQLRPNINGRVGRLRVARCNSTGISITGLVDAVVDNPSTIGCLYGIRMAYHNDAESSFPSPSTAQKQSIRNVEINNPRNENSEIHGISIEDGEDITINDPVSRGNGQSVAMRVRRFDETTAISDGDGISVGAGDSALTKNRIRIINPKSYDGQTLTGIAASANPAVRNVIVTSNPRAFGLGQTIRINGGGVDPNLAIGSTTTNVAYDGFTYWIDGVSYVAAGDAVGVAPGSDVVPINDYGAVAFDIDAAGVITAVSAPLNSVGYTTAALAIADVPYATTARVRLGYVTVTKSDGAFTFGTTALNAANTTVAYTDHVNMLARIVDGEGDDHTLDRDVQVMPESAGTGTVSSSGRTLTGVGTAFLTELTYRCWVKADGEYRRVSGVTSDTAATITPAFTASLSSDSFEIVSLTVDTIPSQYNGIVLGASALSPFVENPDFGDGNVSTDLVDNTDAATPAIIVNPGSKFDVLAASASPVSHTGDTVETTIATVVLPGGRMGKNGILRITAQWSYTNNVNAKTLRTRLGGTVLSSASPTATASHTEMSTVHNVASASSQKRGASVSGGYGASSLAFNTASINTANDANITFSALLASAGDTITLESYLIEVCYRS